MAEDWGKTVDEWVKEDSEFKEGIRNARDPFGRVKVEPPSRRGILGGLRRGAAEFVETLGEEYTAPIRDIPEGISDAAIALINEPKNPTLLDDLRAAGKVLLGGGKAGLSLGRAVFAPATAIVKGVAEAAQSAVEYPGQEDQRSRPLVIGHDPVTKKLIYGPKPTDVLDLVTEIAGSIPVGLTGEKLFKHIRTTLATKAKVPVDKVPDTVVSDFAKKIDEWRAAAAEDEKFKAPLNRWAKQRQIEQEAEAAKIALIKSNAEAAEVVEQERLFRLKERLSQDPVTPGPRNVWPRVEDLPPGESSPWPPRQLTEGTQPKRVIEAPPKSPGSLEDAVLRSKIRREQGEVLGEEFPQPASRVIIEETGYRDPVTGDWVPPKPKMVDVPEPTPGDVPGTRPNAIDRIRGREEVVVGRGQGWIRKGDDLVLIDNLDNINAKIVPSRIGTGAERRIIFQLQDGDGKLIKQFSTIEEAVAAATKKFPTKVIKPPTPPEPPSTPAVSTPPKPTPPTPTTEAPRVPTAAGTAAAEAEAADLRKTFGPAEPVIPKETTSPRPTDVAVDPQQPYKIIAAVDKTRGQRVYDAITEKWRPFSMKVKQTIGLSSPSDIFKDYPVIRRIIDISDETRHAINNKADTFAAAYRELVHTVGDVKEASRLLRLRDARVPMPGVPAAIEQKVDDFYRFVENMTGQLPGESIFKDGFHKRLAQSHIVVDGKLVAKEHTSMDVDRILPKQGGKVLKDKFSKVLTGDEAYTPENIVRTLRAIARQSEMGTKLSPGYMAKIRPLLDEASNMPELVRSEASDLVNHFIGAPGSRSPQWMQRWSDRLRSYQFVSKIAGNVTSPIWNAGQNFLTIAETSVKSFGKARKRMWSDMHARMTGSARDPEYVKLLKDAGIEHELVAPGVLSDIGVLPSDLLGNFDNWLAKAASVGGKGFRVVEKNNRLGAFLSGFEEGVAANMSREQAIAHGKMVMKKTQFTSGEADLPRRFRSAEGAAVGQFKSFTIKYHEYMKENAADLVKSLVNPRATWKEVGTNANKFTKFWGSQLLMAGTGAVPGAEYILGDALKDQPDFVKYGAGGLIGVSLAKQFGVGPLPFENYKDLLYNLPGPTVSAMQDAWALATGVDRSFERYGKELTWDEWERKLLRAMPAGVQLARIVEAVKTFRDGDIKHKSLTPAQAFALEPRSGPKLSEVTTSVLEEFFGTRDVRREKEVDINEKAREEVEIERRARMNASELFMGGKQKEAQAILEKASERLGRKVLMDYGNIKAAQEAEYKTALERLRERQGKRGIVIPKP